MDTGPGPGPGAHRRANVLGNDSDCPSFGYFNPKQVKDLSTVLGRLPESFVEELSLGEDDTAETVFAAFQSVAEEVVRRGVAGRGAHVRRARGGDFRAGARAGRRGGSSRVDNDLEQRSSRGQITKLKLLKRQMYGRASFDLLRRRVLLAA